MFTGRSPLSPSRIVTLAGAALGAWLATGAPLSAAVDTTTPATLVAGAAVPWHANLAAARQASRVSHRPVLVVFTACASESGAALARDVFPAAETVALLTACFEPVQVDVDADPATARSLGVTSVPSACIIDAHDRLLTRFDCPATTAGFVAAVSRASQEATNGSTAGTVVAAAVTRDQSDFVTQAAPPAIADSSGFEEPALAATPPAWQAESATRPMPLGPANAVDATIRQRPTLEPTPAPATNLAPWLNASDTTPAATVAAAPASPPGGGSAAAPAPPAPADPAAKNPAASFFAALQKPFTIFSKPKPPAGPTVAAQASTPTPASQPPAASDPQGTMPLGLEGYCPVSLVDKGEWVEGRAQWGARHRGRTYLFAGAEQQRAFLANPDAYAPALSGDDPVLACDSGRQVAGQRRYGVSYQSRTYLFSSPETRAAFAANPQQYTARVVIAERPTTSDSLTR